jgi:hypothetical protein
MESADGIAFSGKRTDGAYLTRDIARRWIEVCLHGCKALLAELPPGISGRFMLQCPGSAQASSGYGKSFALPAQTSDLLNSAKIASACPPLFPVVVVVSLAARMMWH